MGVRGALQAIRGTMPRELRFRVALEDGAHKPSEKRPETIDLVVDLSRTY